MIKAPLIQIDGTFSCSVCGEYLKDYPSFCPNCHTAVDYKTTVVKTKKKKRK